MIDEIRQLYRLHEAADFPADCRGEQVEGIDLVLLDSDTAGCIETFLGCSGRLDPRRHAWLSTCHAELQRVVPRLEGEARAYYSRLCTLSDLVLRALER